MLVAVFALVISTVSGQDLTECPDKSVAEGASCGAKGGVGGTNCYRRRSPIGNPKPPSDKFPTSLPDQDDICPRIPLGHACAYSFQCSTKFCCPYQKLCLEEENGVGKSIASDKVVYPAGYTAPADAVCKVPTKDATCLECTGCWIAGSTVVPDYVPKENEYDPSKCDCDPKFIEMLNAGTWVVDPAASSADTGVAATSKGGAIGWSVVVALVAERLF